MKKPIYVIVSKHHSSHYFVNALGHEIHLTRFILFDLLQKNLINLDSTIITLYEDRFFLYSKTFQNIITWDDYVTNYKKETNTEIDLTHYSPASSQTQNEQIKEFDEINYKLNNFERTPQLINYINDMNFYDLTSNDEYFDVIKNKFILLHMRTNIINLSNDYVIDVSTNYIDNHLFKIINKIRMYSNLKIVIFSTEKQNICLENVFFINNLQIYASFLNNKNCDLFITEWSGGGQLSQYCCNSKIIYYFNNYVSHDYELLYEKYQNESNKEQNIFCAWDFKSTTSCERIYYKNLDTFLENIHLYMKKVNVINFIFSIGYRCYSPAFLKQRNLRKFSGPFDYLFIDLETSFKIINNNFDNYLHDIILFNKNEKKIDLFYKKHTNKIHENFYKLSEEHNISYMIQNYNHANLIFNQNYLDNNTLNDNLYNWNTICSFHHHNILDNDIYKKLQYRCERFQNIINKYNETTALFYITKIVSCDNIMDYMNKIVEIKKKNFIHCYVIIIVNCDNMEDNSYFNDKDKCLFIIKKVENYETQFSNNDTDNNLNYDKEFNIILNYFTFNLIEKNDV